MPVVSQIAGFHQEMIGWRHDLHANPELGLQETRTSAMVQAKLRSFGVDKIITGLARTGVVGGSMVAVGTDVPSDSAPTSMRCRSMKRPGYPTRRNMTE
jgi:metal-dependent amidase/aminoacylase/carboxypeptidase family protein